MWKVIEQASKSGNRALAEIRERTPTGKPGDKKEARNSQPVDSFATAPSWPKKKGGASTSDSAGILPRKGKRKPGSARHAAETSNGNGDGDGDSDSDGGFFEED